MAGLRLDHSPYNHHPLYTAVIPYVVFGSVLIAAVVPGSLILSCRLPMPRRVLFTALAIVALGIQLFLAFSWVLVSWH